METTHHSHLSFASVLCNIAQSVKKTCGIKITFYTHRSSHVYHLWGVNIIHDGMNGQNGLISNTTTSCHIQIIGHCEKSGEGESQTNTAH